MRWPPGDSGFAANVAITVLATLAIGSVAYAGMVRALHPIAVAFPAASPSPTHRPSISPLPATPAPNPIPAPPPSSSLLALVDLDITDFSTAWLLLPNCTSATRGSCASSGAGTLDGGQAWPAPGRVGGVGGRRGDGEWGAWGPGENERGRAQRAVRQVAGRWQPVSRQRRDLRWDRAVGAVHGLPGRDNQRRGQDPVRFGRRRKVLEAAGHLAERWSAPAVRLSDLVRLEPGPRRIPVAAPPPPLPPRPRPNTLPGGPPP